MLIAATPAPAEVPGAAPIPVLAQRDTTNPAVGPAPLMTPESASSLQSGPELGPAPVQAAVLGTAVEGQSSFRQYSAESVVYFTEIGLGAEYGGSAPVLHRWAQDISIKIHGTPTSDDTKLWSRW